MTPVWPAWAVHVLARVLPGRLKLDILCDWEKEGGEMKDGC